MSYSATRRAAVAKTSDWMGRDRTDFEMNGWAAMRLDEIDFYWHIRLIIRWQTMCSANLPWPSRYQLISRRCMEQLVRQYKQPYVNSQNLDWQMYRLEYKSVRTPVCVFVYLSAWFSLSVLFCLSHFLSLYLCGFSACAYMLACMPVWNSASACICVPLRVWMSLGIVYSIDVKKI